MPLFFGLQRPVEATIDIVALLGINSYLTYVWSEVDEVATYLMFPYLGWLGFAAYLSVRVSLSYQRVAADLMFRLDAVISMAGISRRARQPDPKRIE